MEQINRALPKINSNRKKRFSVLIVYLFLTIAFYSGCHKDSASPVVKPPTEDSTGNQDTTGSQDSYADKIQQADWDSTRISDAVVWKYHHFNDLFDANESITVFDVNLNSKNVSVTIPYVTTGSFLKTSDGAASVDAVAAVNGSYFDTKKGGSTVFFESQGNIISYTSTSIPSYRNNAGFSIDKNGMVSIIKIPTSGWTSTSSYDLLTSGPILVYDGKIMDQADKSFNYERNPRTAIGLTKDNQLICVVVDGRTIQSAGMTNKELAEVMQALNCQSAMNLDGGGSSTAWVKNKGVVNYPSDNKQFDHGGERAVATVIAFVMKK